MNTKTKRTTLMVLSTLTLATAIAPAIGTTEVSAQTATKQATKQSVVQTSELLDKIDFAKRVGNLSLFEHAKKSILKSLPLLSTKDQMKINVELSNTEASLRIADIQTKFDVFLNNGGRELKNVDVQNLKQDVSKIPANSPYFKIAQQKQTSMIQTKAKLDYDTLMIQAQQGALNPEELKQLTSLVQFLRPEAIKASATVVDKLKSEQNIRQLQNTMRLISFTPDKSLIALLEKEVNKISASSGKTDLLSKLKEVKKRERIIPVKDVHQQLMVNSRRSDLGRNDVPSFIQERIKQQLSETKRTNPGEYERHARTFYGKEVEVYYASLRRVQDITSDHLDIFKSKIATFEKESGFVNDRDFMYAVGKMQREADGLDARRVKYRYSTLSSAEVQKTLKVIAVEFPEMLPSIQLSIDKEKSDLALKYIRYYEVFGKKAEDYQAALEKVNDVKTDKYKQMLLEKLNK